jgi:putative membrane protein
MGGCQNPLGRGVVMAVIAVMSIGLPSTSQASTASEERAGARISGAVENGDRTCAQLDRDDFEQVGDFVMGRMAGSTASHEQMDSLMKRMMGASATEGMHIVMGRRFTGCGRGQVPGAFSAMMGMVGGGGGGAGMMGRYDGDGGFGSMMGNLRTAAATDEGNGDLGAAGWAMVAIMAVLLVLAGTALWLWRPANRTRHASAISILSERYARGEIDADDFERRRRALRNATSYGR